MLLGWHHPFYPYVRSAKTDAKETLRRKLDRQRLPNGIEWELADDLPKP